MQSTSGPTSNIRPRIEPQYVRIVGDSVGVVNLTPAALQFLADQVTRLLCRALESGRRYQMHGLRNRLQIEDIEAALKDNRVPLPMGFISRRATSFRQMVMPSGEELYVKDDYDIDVSSLTEQNHSKIPLYPYIKAHWLAVDGKIALVPENIRPIKEEEEEEIIIHDGCGPLNGQVKAASVVMRRETAGGALGASVAFRAACRGISTKEQIIIKAPIVESLSVEQQLYMKEIVEACVGQDDKRRQDALQSLEVDTGIQAILPRLSRMIHYAIRCNVVHRCLSMLIYVVRIIRAVASNKSVKLEGILHELIPSLLSCMVGRILCTRPEADNHWALRDFAGKTLIYVVKVHGVGDTKQRALRTIRRTFEDQKSSYPMIYGTLHPLVELSNLKERAELHNRLVELIEETHPSKHTSASAVESLETQKLHALLVKNEAIVRKSLSGGVSTRVASNTSMQILMV